jgi:hypothetical protein
MSRLQASRYSSNWRKHICLRRHRYETANKLSKAKDTLLNIRPSDIEISKPFQFFSFEEQLLYVSPHVGILTNDHNIPLLQILIAQSRWLTYLSALPA